MEIDKQAVDDLWTGDFKKRFEELLVDPIDGPKRWAADGPQLRDNGRFIGTFAEFFANRNKKSRVELEELLIATTIVSTTCEAVAPDIPPLKYCENLRPDFAAATGEFLTRVTALARRRP